MNRRDRKSRLLAYAAPQFLLRLLARDRCRRALERWHITRSPADLAIAQQWARTLLNTYGEKRLRVQITLEDFVSRAPLWPPRGPDPREEETPVKGTPAREGSPVRRCACGRAARPGHNTCGHRLCLAAYGRWNQRDERGVRVQ